MEHLRQTALAMFRAAVHQADPAAALRRCWRTTPPPAPGAGRCYVIAAGKAAIPMMRAALDVLPRVDKALAITNRENAVALQGADVVVGGHPLPDRGSVEAGRAVRDILSRAGRGDHVVALVSGGGSAILAAPAKGISLEEYARTFDLLLSSGFDILQTNLVRQQVDSLKGGGLARLAAPATVNSYILSDVVGDDLRIIASGPTASPIGTPREAIDLLQEHSLWNELPRPVQACLLMPRPALASTLATNHLIASNSQSLKAALRAAPAGLPVRIAEPPLTGDVGGAADRLLRDAEMLTSPGAVIYGGETTVKLAGSGLGGRNQELALLFAIGAENLLRSDWILLSGGTDGRDGPTGAAGAIVDAGTLGRIRAADADPLVLAKDNDSYRALRMSGDLIITGGTGTNVADVQILLRAGHSNGRAFGLARKRGTFG